MWATKNNDGWILYTHCLLVLSIQWTFRNRDLDLLCMPMHRIGSFHFSLRCYSLSLLFICPSLSFKTFGMFLAPPVLDLSCIRTLDLHLACSLHLLCWILFVFVHWIFDCFVSVAILVINIHASWILDLLRWILFVFFHWIFECSVSVAILVIKQRNRAVASSRCTCSSRQTKNRTHYP